MGVTDDDDAHSKAIANYATKSTNRDGGFEEIEKDCKKLEALKKIKQFILENSIPLYQNPRDKGDTQMGKTDRSFIPKRSRATFKSSPSRSKEFDEENLSELFQIDPTHKIKVIEVNSILKAINELLENQIISKIISSSHLKSKNHNPEPSLKIADSQKIKSTQLSIAKSSYWSYFADSNLDPDLSMLKTSMNFSTLTTYSKESMKALKLADHKQE